MSNVFIQKIIIDKVRRIENFEIPLSTTSKKHLIITGKNGSGKTSLLLALSTILQKVQDLQEELMYNNIEQISGAKVIIEFNNNSLYNLIKERKYIATFFEALRRTEMVVPDGPKKNFLMKYVADSEDAFVNASHGLDNPGYVAYPVNDQFTQYIVNLKADRSFAHEDKDLKTVQQIDQWFDVFERSLKQIFEDEDIKLEFDRRNYTFNLIQSGKEPFSFNTLSDGYSALLNIVTELMLRMNIATHRPKNYDLEGVVLIDEIETHLHVELQKKVLPFLTTFFPKIQFIVTTHSPFVLSSIQDSVICDLEHRLVAEDFSQYSYSAILESYFETDKYSEVLKEKVARYEVLLQQETLRTTEIEEIQALEDYLDNVPKFLASELVVHWQALKLQRLGKVKAE